MSDINYNDKLVNFLHDPIDKCFEIQGHEERANEYSKSIDVTVKKEDYRYSDIIASTMERSLLPPKDKNNEKLYQEFNEIRHPFSTGKIEVNYENALENFKEALKSILSSIKNLDDKKKFYYLWRNLENDLVDKINDNELKKIIPLLPADTRIPDHSIWEHLKITSALNAYDIDGTKIQNNSLFLFSIGPVQSFISQSKKAQDFFWGSFILSYFTFEAIKVIIEKFGPTSIIYPDLNKQPLMDYYIEKNINIEVKNSNSDKLNFASIPNRFVAIIGETQQEEIKNIVGEIRQKFDTIKNNFIEKLYEKFELNKKDKNNTKNFIIGQLSDFPQIYWVALPWRKEGENYNDISIDDVKDFFNDTKINNWKELSEFALNTRNQHGELEYRDVNIGFLYPVLYSVLEKSMGAIKNAREFRQKEEKGRKCILCGEKNVVFYKKTELEKNKTEDEIRKKKLFSKENFIFNNEIPLKYLRNGEGLCSLCFMKRTFDVYLKSLDKNLPDINFPSVVEVAVADFKEKIREFEEYKKYEDKINEYLGNQKVKGLPKLNKEMIDGTLFYEDNLEADKIKEEFGINISESNINELKEHLKKIYKKAESEPNKYYSLIHFDGDNMGKWLSGEKLPDIENAYNSQTWEKIDENFKNVIKKKIKEVNSSDDPNAIRTRKLLTPAIHSSISTALKNYTLNFARKIIEEEHFGKIIYAGGDDVLAFVNLKDIFDIIEKLRFSFSGQVKFNNSSIEIDLNNKNGFVEKDGVYILTLGEKATISMGVVIAHYKEPLGNVIKRVFELEEKAKDNDRDSVAIGVIKKSGETEEYVAKWIGEDENNEKIRFINLVKDILDKFNQKNNKYISANFIKNLEEEFKYLKSEDVESLFKAEIKRLLERAFNSKVKSDDKEKEKKENQQFLEDTNKLLLKLYLFCKDIKDFISILNILAFIKRGV